MSITRKRTIIEHTYSINNKQLTRVTSKRDLGVIFQSNFKFNEHINCIISGANRTLGLIIRHSKYFNDFDTITTLYTALVRSKLEYAAIIWTPKQDFYIKTIEQVQARFVRVLFLKFNGFYPAYPTAISYTTLLEALPMALKIKVPKLHQRQIHRACLEYFDIPSGRSPVGLDSPLVATLITYNMYSSLDLALSRDDFRNKCREKLFLNTA
uniref:Uncharacterized protein n=1 Tax=Cacopsylla melanoneura TaxID=428564 RepID=A0A8D8ZTP8_9HEMI